MIGGPYTNFTTSGVKPSELLSLDMSYSLKSFKGVIIGVIKGDARSFDYSSYGFM